VDAAENVRQERVGPGGVQRQRGVAVQPAASNGTTRARDVLAHLRLRRAAREPRRSR
jgi:hypothetical protein